VETIRAFFDVKNQKNFDTQVNYYTEDAFFKDPSAGQAIHGREAIKVNSTSWNTPLPDHVATNLQIHDAGDMVVAQLLFEGTQNGPLGPYAPTGRPITIPVCFVFHFSSAGGIVEGEVYYCKLRFLEQLGFAHEVATHPTGQGSDLSS
jgi:ketosteroid isomerase-like protein